jgi:hypothetical protein
MNQIWDRRVRVANSIIHDTLADARVQTLEAEGVRSNSHLS